MANFSNRLKDKKILQNFLAVGEKGGTWAEFDDKGNLIENKDDNISVPKDIQKEVRNLINNEYSDSMFFDESKLTMISTEMRDRHSLDDYKEQQKTLSDKLKSLLVGKKLEDKFKVDPTTIAVDVENKHVGKGFAIERILKWLQQRKIKPRQFIAFGDSRGDIEMAETLHQNNLPFTFVYVGNRETLEGKEYPFPITYTQNRFGKGTLEFLKTS